MNANEANEVFALLQELHDLDSDLEAKGERRTWIAMPETQRDDAKWDKKTKTVHTLAC